MQIVIDISEEDYIRIKDIPDAFDSLTSRAYKSIKKGLPLLSAKWVEKEVRGSKCLCCSNCGEESGTLYDYNFCPWCGALMEVK